MGETAPALPFLVAVPPRDDADVVESLPLPGVETEELGKATPLEGAIIATLTEYRAADLLKPRDAAKVALALDICRVMAIKRRSGRTSTYSNDARLLYEILDSFVAEETGADAALVEAMRQWSEYLAGLAS